MFGFRLSSLWSCSWPHLSSSDPSINGVGASGDYVKVAVITDPQIMDKTSLHLPPKSSDMETLQFYTDLYMRRAFLLSIPPLKPDGGPYLSDEETAIQDYQALV